MTKCKHISSTIEMENLRIEAFQTLTFQNVTVNGNVIFLILLGKVEQ